jgi:ubiquinone/menaquinone biosynthesis C-methylase UbiE
MIDEADKDLTELGMRDKFELVVADIFDPSLVLSEKVDYVICQYALTTFINSQEMLKDVLAACKRLTKDDGVVAVLDFYYTKCGPEEKVGCYNRPIDGRAPGDFDNFDFLTDAEPDQVYKIFNIPAHLMF